MCILTSSWYRVRRPCSSVDVAQPNRAGPCTSTVKARECEEATGQHYSKDAATMTNYDDDDAYYVKRAAASRVMYADAAAVDLPTTEIRLRNGQGSGGSPAESAAWARTACAVRECVLLRWRYVRCCTIRHNIIVIFPVQSSGGGGDLDPKNQKLFQHDVKSYYPPHLQLCPQRGP